MRSAGTSPSQGSDQNYAHYVTFLFPECPTCSTVPLSHYNVNIALEGPLRIQQAAREAATNAPPLQVYLWPFELESGVRVTCDMGYLCANFSLPRPLYFWLRPDVRDRQTSDVRQTDVRQTDVRCTSSLNAPYPRGGVIISCAGGRHNMPPPTASWPLTFWPWKWCPSHVWRGPILVFLGLSVLELGPMYLTDRQTDVRQKHRLKPPSYGRRHNNQHSINSNQIGKNGIPEAELIA